MMEAKPVRMTDAVPETWRALLHDADSPLVDLLSDCVERKFGFRPHPDFVSEFLRRQLSEGPRSAINTATPSGSGSHSPSIRGTTVAPKTIIKKRQGTKPARQNVFGFWIQGTYHPCRYGTEVLVEVFETLGRRDPQFLERFSARKERQRGSHGRTRRFLARTPEDLYPNNPELTRFAKRLGVSGEWWLDTNLNSAQKLSLVEEACEIVGLRYGVDLKVDLW